MVRVYGKQSKALNEYSLILHISKRNIYNSQGKAHFWLWYEKYLKLLMQINLLVQLENWRTV
jgi:hypothetical protein